MILVLQEHFCFLHVCFCCFHLLQSGMDDKVHCCACSKYDCSTYKFIKWNQLYCFVFLIGFYVIFVVGLILCEMLFTFQDQMIFLVNRCVHAQTDCVHTKYCWMWIWKFCDGSMIVMKRNNNCLITDSGVWFTAAALKSFSLFRRHTHWSTGTH